MSSTLYYLYYFFSFMTSSWEGIIFPITFHYSPLTSSLVVAISIIIISELIPISHALVGVERMRENGAIIN